MPRHFFGSNRKFAETSACSLIESAGPIVGHGRQTRNARWAPDQGRARVDCAFLGRGIKTYVHSEILAQFNQVAEEQDKRLVALGDNLELMESGLDSLCLATIVSRLENILGIEPFSTAEDVAFPRTLGEFIKFYENAAK